MYGSADKPWGPGVVALILWTGIGHVVLHIWEVEVGKSMTNIDLELWPGFSHR